MPAEARSAAPFVPQDPTLTKLRSASKTCKGCELYRVGTQTVFGDGPKDAKLMFVGEQPGDQEDRAGKPFVGPSGKLLDSALEAAGIDRGIAYVTNAVKHFRWEKRPGSTKRIHKKPSDGHVRACHPWLDAELAVLRPSVVVALGATAAQSLLGKQFRVSTQRGKPQRPWGSGGAVVIATVHPSAVLRAPADQRAEAEKQFMADIRKVAKYL